MSGCKLIKSRWQISLFLLNKNYEVKAKEKQVLFFTGKL